MKLTDKQEKFAQCVASGMTQSDAYREAYGTENMTDNSIHVNASKTSAKAKVALRVNELKQKIEEQTLKRISMTKAEVIEALIDIHILAKEDKQYAASKGAVELVGKEMGMFVDNKKIIHIRRVEEMADAELDAILAAGENPNSAPDGTGRKAKTPGETEETRH